MAVYTFQVVMTGLDTSRANEVMEALRLLDRGLGKARLRALVQRAAEGEEVRVYGSNSLRDARETAASLRRAGAVVEVKG